MSSDDPVTLWIDELRLADAAAAQRLWNHFFSRLYQLGRAKLRLQTRRVYDEEDAALSAFHSVCAGISAGRFPDLHDRGNLWQLLVVITARKVAHRQRYDRQQRRDVRRNLSDDTFARSAQESVFVSVDLLPSREPTAEFVTEFVETCQRLIEDLADSPLRQVVELRMQGYTDSEIADQLKCSRRTVQRRLEIIRRRWDPAGAAP
jgi:DNA-directed RNA polymerase specialized sigma24 family protein